MKNDNSLITLIFPCFNEAQNLGPLLQAIEEELSDLSLEIIFVDDGSSDETLSLLRRLGEKDARIKYAALSRNFGQQAALSCGLDLACGNCCVVMDADLQHPVHVVRELIALWKQGFSIVRTVRIDNGDSSFFKRYSSKLFYKLMQRLSLKNLKPGMADFYLLDREVVDVVNKLKEQRPFLRGMLSWVGYDTAEVTYEPNRRLHGKAKYSFLNMLKLAIHGITSFSTLPLWIAAGFGLLFLSGCFAYILYVLFVHFILKATVPGWSSLMIVTLGCNGATLFSLGILGQYIGLAYLEGKARPPYLVKETNINAREA
jgi:polyisoprenyl-phosphate glycosyltransferase